MFHIKLVLQILLNELDNIETRFLDLRTEVESAITELSDILEKYEKETYFGPEFIW